jgi:PKD repeat protein
VAISGSLSNALRMYTLVGTTPTLTDNGNITVPAFSPPPGVPQPGTTDTLDSSDTRLTQANAAFDPALKAFGIWTQHTIAGAGNGPSVVRWYELKAGQTTPVQTGTVAVSGAFVFNGAISPTSAGNAAAIDYNVGSSTVDVQVRARVHPFGSAPGTMSSETVVAGSSGVDNDFSCPSWPGGGPTCRWGDYAGAGLDPLGCGASVWGTNELNGTPDGLGDAEWKSQNFRLQVDECPTAGFSVTTSAPAHGAPVGFNAAASGDADGSILSYVWRFGDGSTLTTTSATTTHTFAAAGTYTVTLIVHDRAGLIAVVSRSVVVK